MNKKIPFSIAIIIIIILGILVYGLIYWQKYSERFTPYTVNCYKGSEIIKESIPCSSDEDCGRRMVEYCKPGFPNIFGFPNGLKCTGAKYYCGDDGFCKGRGCPVK